MKIERSTWKTSGIIQETTDALTIQFDTKGQPFTYKAGQFINLSFEINGDIAVRSYSLSSAPANDAIPAITLKRVEGGLVSNHVLNEASVIKTWHVEGPFGMFGLPSNTNCQTLTFIAGGSGITPVFSMIKEALHASSCPIILIYSNKTPDDTIFFKELLSLKERFPDRLKIQFVFTGELSDDQKMQYVSGRLNRLVLKKLLGITKFTEFFLLVFLMRTGRIDQNLQ